ncbi:acyltransferase [Mycolicibacterium sp. CBMA 226]|uniref:acyltransferase family protein n=1 Tax=Mycolicibacterium sp. CBMA 226 TaxID=2606611 RepID=UPI0012DBE156|nr:acyltransferase [Mycolicibacterium sp. CBMA 226]MUL78574.1 acyltransferase [Mycolicibacterium sp. CBMA 226]
MTAPAPEPVSGTRGFLPAVEGLRAAAALGVVLTHVALQTGYTDGVFGRLLARFDLAVAVFFALSGFLLWRGHAAAAHGFRAEPAVAPYYRSRLVRIMPAYLVTVVAVLTLLPDAHGADRAVWIANLTLTQVSVPKTLIAGLTQMWSLSVEMAFYLVVPLLALLAAKLAPRLRIPVIAGVALLSFGWGYLPIPAYYGANPLNWLPAYASWFAVGMLLAEWMFRPFSWLHRLARQRSTLMVVAVVAFLVAASPLAMPGGHHHATLGQFIARTALGAVVAGALLAPLVLDAPGDQHRVLGSAPMVTLGRWSYGLFLWHLAALDMVLAMLGQAAFPGALPVVMVLTTTFGFAVAAVSYALLEEPCRMALRRWEGERRPTVAGCVSSVRDSWTR